MAASIDRASRRPGILSVHATCSWSPAMCVGRRGFQDTANIYQGLKISGGDSRANQGKA